MQVRTLLMTELPGSDKALREGHDWSVFAYVAQLALISSADNDPPKNFLKFWRGEIVSEV